MIRLLCSLLIMLFLTACASTPGKVENKLGLLSLDLQGGTSEVVAIGVLDARPYVVNGEKHAKYIGQFQLSMGDPYDAFTKSKQPMAHVFTDKLPALLGEQFPQLKTVYLDAGMSKQESVVKLLETGASKVILITLKEWRSLTKIDTSLRFDVQLETFNSDKQLLAYKRVQGHDTFGGATVAGPITNAKRTLPHAYRQKMQAVFSDSLVMASISSEKAIPIAVRPVDDTSEPNVVVTLMPEECTVELVLYWKNAGMPDQEILSKCNSIQKVER